jgi:WXG100 family type VII secretion target
MPDINHTDVDSAALGNIASSIGEDIKELEYVLKQIGVGTASTLNQYWQGAAKDSFDAKRAGLSDNLTKFIESYKTLNEKLTKAAASYDKADGVVNQAVARLPR